MTDTIQAPPRVGYALRVDRCVIEVTARLLGLPLARARFDATEGELVVDGDRSLVLTVDAGSLKTATPLLGPALRGPKYLSAKDFETIRFETRIVRVPARRRLDFVGRITVHGTWYNLTLRSRIVVADHETMIISGRGRVGRLHVEIAAEFDR